MMRNDVGRKRLRSGLALGGVLLLAAMLRSWRLGENGHGREYFAAGVRSMLESWHNLFYASFDPAGFVSLDKPPVAFWIQAASAKLLGFSGVSLLLPQVLEGVAAVFLLHHLVRPRFGRVAALLAALFLAVTPISVAIDRSNNTDSCLVLMLLLAAWAAIRAAETASAWRLSLSMTILGVAFNVKMLAGLIVAPSLMLAYLIGAMAVPLPRRLMHLAAAGLVLIGVSLSWSAIYDLTPPANRPFVSGSRDNSMLELALLYNGLKRFEAAESAAPSAPPRLYDDTPVGPLRLATPRLAAQVLWLLPLALAGALLGAWRGGRDARISTALWTAWALTYGLVYSAAGGVFHAYYLATMAPALAALAGIGVAMLLAAHRRGGWHAAWLPVALLLTAGWQAYVQYGYASWSSFDWRTWLYLGTSGAVAAGALGLIAQRRSATVAVPLALVALLVTPTGWALSTVLVPTNVASPRADIAALADPKAPRVATDRGRLLRFLAANHSGERYVLALPNAVQAAPLILRSGQSIMAMGGYLGTDPILTPDDLAVLVAQRQVRFIMLGGYSLVPADQPRQQALAAWVRQHGAPVDPELWRPAVVPPASNAPLAGYYTRPRLYDLRAGDGLVALRAE